MTVSILDPAHPDLALMATMDGISDSSLVDQSGTLAAGTISGATTAAGLQGDALIYDGNDYVAFQSDSEAALAFVHTTGMFHIATWVKFNNSNGGTLQAMLGNTPVSTADKGFGLLADDRSASGANRALLFAIVKGTSGVAVASLSINNAIPDDTDYHLYELSGDGAAVTAFVDGQQLVGSAPIGALGSGNTTRPLSFGRVSHASATYNMAGGQDVTRFWRRPLTESERAQVLEEPRPYQISGTVTQDGAPFATEIRLYDATTGALVDIISSDAAGAYQKALSTADPVYAMSIPSAGYRPLVHGPISPALKVT
uniref:hypothetical protein n=1 Tax=Marinobacterium profundum TaxID=1714300 RepID=UPI000832BBDA|nr:hypothetical protein [Marinobacterium profundum]